MSYNFNKYQTQLTDSLLKEFSKEEKALLIDYMDNIQFIRNLVRPDRPYAKNLEKDELGRIKVDITNPHILENMDYFRQPALHFKKHGKYTNLHVNTHPQSEYTKFWKEEARRCREGYIRESDGEWITGYNYFYWNYSPILLSKKHPKVKKEVKVRELPHPWDNDYLFFHYLEQASEAGQHANILKTRGRGFEQPISELVLTPTGFIPIGNLNVGDFVIGKDGKKTKVEKIIPQGFKDIYEVEFSDNRKVKCGLNHLWGVYNTKRKYNVVTTEYLLSNNLKQHPNTNKSSYSYRIPQTEPVNFKQQDLLINPYLLGLLIGDGSISNSTLKFTTSDEELILYIRNILKDKYTVTKDKWTKFGYIIKSNTKNINKLTREIKELGLNKKSYDKFIPNCYKYGSVQQRFELVKGLMDTDGTTNKYGNSRFISSSEKLIDDLAWVLRSLGIRCFKCKTNLGGKLTDFGNGYKSIVRDSWVLSITTTKQIFKLKRKFNTLNQSIQNRKINTQYIGIKSIKKLNYKEESVCIYINNEDHLYLTTDFIPTHNSYKGASINGKVFILGDRDEPEESRREQTVFNLANEKEFLTKDGILNKFIVAADWCADHTPWPRNRLKSSMNDMNWTMGYVNKETGRQDGVLNTVQGVSLKNDPDKARGKRGVVILWEEMGKFPGLLHAWGVARPSVEDGDTAFGLMAAFGTGGTEGSDFAAAEEMFYNPDGYNIYKLKNVYDKNTSESNYCAFFSAEYMNRKGCYDFNGNSDVIKALIQIVKGRIKIKYGSSDPNALTQEKSERPITPQESVLRKEGNLFPAEDLKDHLSEIMVKFDQYVSPHYVGRLGVEETGDIKWKIDSSVTPIREYPLKDNLNKAGAVEIFRMPVKSFDGSIPYLRYIAGSDVYDDDESQTNSLGSVFIFDRFTDQIVAEYTGRPKTAHDFYEIVLRLCKFYHALLLYENNKKGLFSYFSNRNALNILADTPEILKDMDMVRASTAFGNKSKGVHATEAVNAFGRRLQAHWMLSSAVPDKPVEQLSEEEQIKNGNDASLSKMNLHNIRSIGYINEAIAWNPDANFDRVSAMNMTMILREELAKHEVSDISTARINKANDPFFNRHQIKYKDKQNIKATKALQDLYFQ